MTAAGRVAGTGIAAAVLLGAEALGVAGLTVWQVWLLVADGAASPATAIALIVLTAVGAAALAAFAVATARGQSWGRSGGIVVQLLILAVALGAITGQYAHPLIALTLAIPAIGTLLLLVAAARSAAR